jgi:hypothetical protein
LRPEAAKPLRPGTNRFESRHVSYNIPIWEYVKQKKGNDLPLSFLNKSTR